MAEDETTVAVGERKDPDKAPEQADKAAASAARPAEVSNLDIVRHYSSSPAIASSSPTTSGPCSGARIARSRCRSR